MEKPNDGGGKGREAGGDMETCPSVKEGVFHWAILVTEVCSSMRSWENIDWGKKKILF